jgi:hypothetical protein
MLRVFAGTRYSILQEVPAWLEIQERVDRHRVMHHYYVSGNNTDAQSNNYLLVGNPMPALVGAGTEIAPIRRLLPAMHSLGSLGFRLV